MPRFYSLLFVLLVPVPAVCEAGVPVIYSTDLYHPPDDPDDHYDLATLFAMPELDVKGIIIDMSNIHEKREQHPTGKKPGRVALEQMFYLSGRSVPVALGLERPLQSVDDQALDHEQSSQDGVRMILSTLETSTEKVCIFTVGSLRDVAAAYNRKPQLLRSKVKAVYINAGTGPDRYQKEWNVRLDPAAYRRVLLSDLPIRWYPCFGRENYCTYFQIDQSKVVGDCAAALKAYFHYALTHAQEDPIQYLTKSRTAPEGPRNMWCTASFIDLAGRKIYQTEKGFEALAKPPGDRTPIECYKLVPVKLTQSPSPDSLPADSSRLPNPEVPFFHGDLHGVESNVLVLRKQEPEYTKVMTSCLKNLLDSFPMHSRLGLP